MSSAHCAAGDLTALPVSFSAVVTYTSRINEYGEDRQYLSHHAISTTFAGQRAYCLREHASLKVIEFTPTLKQRAQNPIHAPHARWFADADSGLINRRRWRWWVALTVLCLTAWAQLCFFFFFFCFFFSLLLVFPGIKSTDLYFT